MKIAAHRLRDAPFIAAHASGGEMKPTLIVLHDTAGRLEANSSVNWFASDECSTSAHVVIERDGTVTQMVPFNKRAFHAGVSEWKGKAFCNAFSIGIEIVNPGKLDKDGRAWFHKKTEAGFTGTKRAKTKEHGDGWWLPYTPEQIEAVTALCKALVASYPIEDITTHWAVSPGRKIDTGPLFPLDDVRRDAFAVRTAEAAPAIEPMAPPVVQPVAEAMKSSRTIFGVIAAFGASLVGWFKDAVAQVELFAPVKQLGEGLGLNLATIVFGLTVAGLALALFARLDDAAKGKVVK
jgi:N-acetylmuramoyl-L-alanine amidase